MSAHSPGLADDIGSRLGTALRERFGEMSSPAKRLARRLGISEPTARSMFSGSLPATPTFLMALDMLGVNASAKVMERLVGKRDNNAQRLAAMEASLQEFKRNVEAIRVESSEGRARVAGLLGFGSGGVVGTEGGGAVRVAGESVEQVGQHAEPALSLVATRTTLEGIPRGNGEALRRHLSLSGRVVSLDAVRALVRGDNLGRTGLAYKHPGEDWKALVAPENRLWVPSSDPRPITEFAGSVTSLRNDLDEAAHSSDPLFVTHAGALLRDGNLVPFHSAVVRIGGRAECGAAFVLTDFCRLGVAA